MLKFDVSGLADFEGFLKASPEVARQSMSFAINDVLTGTGLARYRKAVAAEVQFPPGYVNDKIELTQRATPTRLVATITGRQRPTSLARFVTAGTVGGQGGVTVRVKGGSRSMKAGFLVRLKQGASITDDGYNIGLAYRLKPGETIARKKDSSRMVHLEANVVLLYGPSVDQILRNEAAEAETPEVLDSIAKEFFRQYDRLS